MPLEVDAAYLGLGVCGLVGMRGTLDSLLIPITSDHHDEG